MVIVRLILLGLSLRILRSIASGESSGIKRTPNEIRMAKKELKRRNAISTKKILGVID